MTNSSEHRHVAVLPFPFSTHAAPILSIIRRLATAAPNITFSFLSTPQSIQTLFPSRGNPENNNVRPYAVSDGVPEGYVFSGRHHEDINLFLAAGKASFEAGMRVAEADIGRRIDCVVADAFMWFSCELAEEMGVPWVTLWVSGACSLVAHCCTDLIRETVGMHDTAGRENEIVKFVPGYSEVRLGDLPSGVVYGNLDSPFSMMLYKMGQVLQKATAVAINSFDELEPEPIEVLESKFQKLLTCGPFNSISPTPSSNLDEYGCIPWLDQRKAASVAYIGFGSVATPPPVEIAALAEALEASSTPFLWSLRENFKLHLPEGFLKRTSELGKFVPWAPQVQVLAHSSIGVFINHCGWNSVVESIEAGVPIIGRPFFGDHQVDTWMVENVWKIGVRVEGGVFTRSSTMSALELVFSHEKGKEMREQIGKYKEFALKAFGPKGRSTQNLNTLLEIVAGYNL